ncbi:apolipoprotein N-acyltransferase [Croceibacterium aestuarii]|uniref:apolipoprotein N-acyltransferase n=1 Tax=Croceibacterium aestuarii TaxID=3064139 RepID=UPI00272EA499|nr:apolipoprotein N-acyltransferase [Croceibacterium sp. D39]
MERLSRALTWFPDRPRIAAFGFGVLAATGFQPWGLWPLALLAMGGFALLLPRAPGWRQAAVTGWFFGIGHFTLGNAWIATAFTYQANMPPALGWIAVPLLALYLAVFPALAAAGARALAGRIAFPLAFAGCWVLSEWLRGWLFTGYPWNPFAMVLLGPFDRPGLAAIAPWMGTYALSGVAVLVSVLLAAALAGRRWLPFGLAAALLGAGMYLPAGPGAPGSTRFTLVQPDIRQEQLDDPRFYEDNFRKTVQLSTAHDPGAERLLLWPESGVPDYLEDGYPQRFYDAATAFADPALARRRIGQAIGPGSTLLTGTVDLKIEDGRAVGAFNVVTAVDSAGAIVASYAKAHLVPYGEYLPLRWLLEPLGATRLVPGALDFLPGPGPRTLDLGGLGKAGVQICYEIVFSGQVVDAAHRPDYIFNPSNDGWFGPSGPPQHLAQARMRAIEEGLPILRATTTGISAIIDARGVVRDHIGRLRAGRMDGTIPPPAPPTLFARTGNLLALGWALLFLLAGLVVTRQRDR